VNWEDFDAHFDRFTRTVFRLETLQDYTAPGEAERVEAFRCGRPRPERSVRTSPWLARIAVATVTEAKRWQRVRVVEEPLTGYTRYQLAGYAESQAAGEEIRIVRRTAAPALATLRRDFWLFDQGTPIAFALLLDYSPTGEWRGGEIITDSQALLDLQAERDLALQWAVPLNEYLAQMA
jgi:hypothetical protein